MIKDIEFSRKTKNDPTLIEHLTELMTDKGKTHNNLVGTSKKKIKNALIGALVLLGICLLTGIIVSIVMKNFIPFIILLIVGIVIASLIYFTNANSVKRKYLTTLTPSVVEALYGPNAEYYQTGGFSRDYLTEAQLFPVCQLKQEDHIIGHFQGVPFAIADVTSYHIETRRDGDRTYTETVYDFVGSVLSVKMNKPAKYPLRLISEAVFSLGSFSKSDETINFESSEFNKLFNCYCQDRQEAFYLMTPQLQLALITIAKGIPGNMSLRFYDQELIIAFRGNSTNFNKIKLNNKDLNYNINVILDAILLPAYIIDTMNLDHKFFITQEDVNKFNHHINDTDIDDDEYDDDEYDDDDDLSEQEKESVREALRKEGIDVPEFSKDTFDIADDNIQEK